MIYAADAGTPAGVFLRINHDNNHHLYSLWLQAIGSDAAPWLARLPAIAAGTACVLVAALLVGRRSRSAGLVARLAVRGLADAGDVRVGSARLCADAAGGANPAAARRRRGRGQGTAGDAVADRGSAPSSACCSI